MLHLQGEISEGAGNENEEDACEAEYTTKLGKKSKSSGIYWGKLG
jgi:hypothetical protein